MEDQMSGRGLTLLVVEDDIVLLKALQDILETAGYQVRTATHGEEALESFREKKPDLIISDISMPIMDGLQLCEAVRGQPGGLTVPFIFLTTHIDDSREEKLQGRSLGVEDYIHKPITGNKLIAAVQSRLQRTDELELVKIKGAYTASLSVLANAIEARDPHTRRHVDRVNTYAQTIARELEWEAAKCEILEFGAILHDLGKINLPSSILRKREPLTEEESEDMRRHPEYGAQMVEDIPYLAPAKPIILFHHEKWDGSGYPEGLRGTEIPEEARLVAVANAFDIMTSDQPYRTAIAATDAFKEIMNNSGSPFDPKMVKAFRRCWDRGEIQSILKSSR
jgi:putative two-component system response regulator